MSMITNILYRAVFAKSCEFHVAIEKYVLHMKENNK